ncbi:uncharacterized protein LOC113509359 [Galleria mellonella]|uniref:Uncharacterized protein LOC113509359 n=1 Tax=Galleria mellonella TaxID=7137 RepID=A0ABM3ME24_GALME|nr:uncharacterized protein LOC113509359 [Galleria mellonella]
MAAKDDNAPILIRDNKSALEKVNECSDEKPENIVVTNTDEGKNHTCNGNKMEDTFKQNGDGTKMESSKDLLVVPRGGQRKSFMEEECAKEKMRLSLLKQCSAILKQNDEKYTKETLHRTFQDEIVIDDLINEQDETKAVDNVIFAACRLRT